MATDTAQVSPPSRRDPRQLVNTLKKTVNYNDAGIASGLAFDNSIPAAAFITQCLVEIVTVFNAGSTNVLTVGGNSTNYNDFVAAGDVDETSAAVTAVTRPLGRSLTASADYAIFAKYVQTGTPGTTGVAIIVICFEGGWST